ncbi:thermonuclease family protein [Acidovorax sp.]|uniref:thermonuclease family protein n=1 Tax=Acidovorax sp. TaxID=1872122 RepID=UPI00391F52D4
MTATVTRVIDGDTLQVNTPTGPERVRINQIDAPERSQAYGLQATQCLANLVQNQSVSMCRDGADRYGRTVASITTPAGNVGATMVSQGCALAYTKYLEAGSSLPALQANAQAAGLGLWAIAGVVPAWQYRAAVGPVTATNGVPAVNVSAPTTAAVHDRIFDWVEHKFPDHAVGGTGTTFDGSAFARCYAGNLCVRILAGRLALVNPDGSVVDVGFHGDFIPVIEAEGF